MLVNILELRRLDDVVMLDGDVATLESKSRRWSERVDTLKCVAILFFTIHMNSTPDMNSYSAKK